MQELRSPRAERVSRGLQRQTRVAGKGGSRRETCSLWMQGNLTWPKPATFIHRTAVIKATPAHVPGAPGVRLLVELVVRLLRSGLRGLAIARGDETVFTDSSVGTTVLLEQAECVARAHARV
jgi:hypothetical protein